MRWIAFALMLCLVFGVMGFSLVVADGTGAGPDMPVTKPDYSTEISTQAVAQVQVESTTTDWFWNGN